MLNARSWLLMLILSGAYSCAHADSDCLRWQEAFKSATELAQAVEVVEQMRATPACSGAVGKAGSLVEGKLGELLDTSRATEAADPTARNVELGRRAELAELWLRIDPNAPKALLARAERQFTEKQWEAAARNADIALYTLLDLKVKQQMGSGDGLYEESDLDLAYRIDAEARRLAKAYVERDATRSESRCKLTRSAGYAPPAEPVQFYVGSDRFTPKGRRAADTIANFVANDCVGKRRISLIGHTDPSLDAVHNCGLSERRAQALRQHIREIAKSKTPEIVTIGLGESAPLRDLDPTLSKEEKFTLLRRVEFVLGELPPPPDCRARGENTADY